MALLLFYACAHEELCPPPSTQDCIVATMNAPAATKTAMGEAEDGTSAVGILWTAEDNIRKYKLCQGNRKNRYTYPLLRIFLRVFSLDEGSIT